MKIAMIGASGFVGTRPLDLLCQEPSKYDCRNIDLLPSHFFNDITTIGDVRQQEQMDRELKGAGVVILLAAQHRDDVSPVSLFYDTNVGGKSVQLLRWCFLFDYVQELYVRLIDVKSMIRIYNCRYIPDLYVEVK